MNLTVSAMVFSARRCARIVAATLSIVVSTSSHAGPFGLDMGATLPELNAQVRLKPESRNEFSASTLPMGHRDFSTYRMLISPVHGLCRIAAWTRPLHTNPQGREIRRQFDALSDELAVRYGAGKRFDLLHEQSLLRSDDDWMVTLYRHDRQVYATWSNEEGSFDGHVIRVWLSVQAVGVSRARLRLDYDFENTNECLNEARMQRADRL